MTTYNTGNPLGSSDPRDLYDNAENLDNFVNGAQAAYNDRLGKSRRSWQSVEDQANQQEVEFNSDQSSREAVFSDFLQASGYQTLGEYAPGIEITAHNQYVTFGGQPYLLKPSIPVPYTTSGAWTGDDFKLIGDGSLRQDLANPDKGAAMVARSVVCVDGLKGLASIPPELRRADLRYENDGFYVGGTVGGGSWKWKPNEPKANHNGGTVVDPVRVSEWDGTQGDLATLFSTGSGTGCFVRVDHESGWHRATWFGCSDGASFQGASINKCAQAAGDGGLVLVDAFILSEQAVTSLEDQTWYFQKEIKLETEDEVPYLFFAGKGVKCYDVKLNADWLNNPIISGSGKQGVANGGKFFNGYLINGAHNILISAQDNIYAENVIFDSCGEHICYLSGGQIARGNAVFKNCTFKNPGLSSQHSEAWFFQLRNYSDVTIDNCYGYIDGSLLSVGFMNQSTTLTSDPKPSNNVKIIGGSFEVAGFIAVQGAICSGFLARDVNFVNKSENTRNGFNLQGSDSRFINCKIVKLFPTSFTGSQCPEEFIDCEFYVNVRAEIQGDVAFTGCRFEHSGNGWASTGLFYVRSGSVKFNNCEIDGSIEGHATTMIQVQEPPEGMPHPSIIIDGLDIKVSGSNQINISAGNNHSIENLKTLSGSSSALVFRGSVTGYALIRNCFIPGDVNLSGATGLSDIYDIGNVYNSISLPE